MFYTVKGRNTPLVSFVLYGLLRLFTCNLFCVRSFYLTWNKNFEDTLNCICDGVAWFLVSNFNSNLYMYIDILFVFQPETLTFIFSASTDLYTPPCQLLFFAWNNPVSSRVFVWVEWSLIVELCYFARNLFGCSRDDVVCLWNESLQTDAFVSLGICIYTPHEVANFY